MQEIVSFGGKNFHKNLEYLLQNSSKLKYIWLQKK
jgi:hypothetical protein